MRRTVILIVGVAMALAGAACGSSSSSSSTTTTSTSAPSSTQPGGNVAGDRAVAQQINIQASDFPSGWKSQPASPSSGGNAATRQLFSCLGVAPSLAATTANVDSPDFSMNQSPGKLSASSNVGFAVTAAQGMSAFQALSSPQAVPCVQKVLTSTLQQQNLPGLSAFNVTSAPVAVPSGDQGVGFAGTASITSQGMTLPIQFQVALVLRGRAELTLTTGGAGSPFPPNLQQSLLSAMTGRANQVPV